MVHRYKFIFACLISVLLFGTSTLLARSNASNRLNESKLVVISLDGVEWQRVLPKVKSEKPHKPPEERDQPVLLTELFKDHGHESLLFGGPGETISANRLEELANEYDFAEHFHYAPHMVMTTSKSNRRILSTPAYQTIMTGSPANAEGNRDIFGRFILKPTFAEIVAISQPSFALDGTSEMAFANYASWGPLVTSLRSTLRPINLVNTGLSYLKRMPPKKYTKAEIRRMSREELERAQYEHLPEWSNNSMPRTRDDEFTFYLGLNHIAENPVWRYVYFGFDNADEYGHRGNRQAYEKQISRYNEMIAELIITLRETGDWEHTTVLIFTDHGRGNGTGWIGHDKMEEAKYIWFYAVGPYVREPSNEKTSHCHYDILPTVLALYGLQAKSIQENSGSQIIQPISGSINLLPAKTTP